MKIRFSFPDHLYKKGYAYVLVAVAVVVGFAYAVTAKTALKRREKFAWFIATDAVDVTGLKTKTLLYADEKVKDVSTRYLAYDSEMFSSVYQTYGTEAGDVSILDADAATSLSMNYYVALDASCRFYSDTNFTSGDDSLHYGILVHDENVSFLEDYITYEEGKTYYLFLNQDSKHLKGFTDSETDSSLIYDLLEDNLR